MNEKPDSGWEWLAVYFYRADGMHSGATWAKTWGAFVKMLPKIREQVKDGLEVRITNTADALVFHATGDGIAWDGMNLGPLLAGEH